MLVSIYGATTAVPGGGGGDWGAYLGAFLPAALLGLAVIAYLVRKLDKAQAEAKELSERVISTNEVMIPLLKDASEALEGHQEVIAEVSSTLADVTVELRRLRLMRDAVDRERP